MPVFALHLLNIVVYIFWSSLSIAVLAMLFIEHKGSSQSALSVVCESILYVPGYVFLKFVYYTAAVSYVSGYCGCFL